ncbi:MAG: hypothetical protein VKL59_11965 [Nostocaceae cyanobacterium]|nr:hypothetical protein [Nostocaceae cyanobacterium]
MHIQNNNFYQEVVDKELSLTGNRRSEIKQEPTKPHEINIPQVDISWAAAFSCVAISWASAFFLLIKLLKSVQYPATLKRNFLHQLPCKNCKYFCNNNYLKCAVQPDLVMTEQASDCSDYCPKNGNIQGRNWKSKK